VAKKKLVKKAVKEKEPAKKKESLTAIKEAKKADDTQAGAHMYAACAYWLKGKWTPKGVRSKLDEMMELYEISYKAKMAAQARKDKELKAKKKGGGKHVGQKAKQGSFAF